MVRVSLVPQGRHTPRFRSQVVGLLDWKKGPTVTMEGKPSEVDDTQSICSDGLTVGVSNVNHEMPVRFSSLTLMHSLYGNIRIG